LVGEFARRRHQLDVNGESKEAIAGYWFILANSLDEAAQIAKCNPCPDRGMFFEIRPIDPEPANPDNTR